MRVAVVCFGRMREYLPDPKLGRVHIEVEAGATVRAVIGTLGAPETHIHSVLIDGLRVDLDSPVPGGSEVTLMPPFAGG
jgi:molybdopterin converting factor small subunit